MFPAVLEFISVSSGLLQHSNTSRDEEYNTFQEKAGIKQKGYMSVRILYSFFSYFNIYSRDVVSHQVFLFRDSQVKQI